MQSEQKIGSPLVSVIVPVYNAMPYLKECLDSICAQTYKELEIICVNDGSTDDSLQTLQKYAADDFRIHVLTQKNLYAGAARNTGLDAATGKYCLFLDSDDFFELVMVEQMVKQIEQDRADICVCRFDVFDTMRGKYIPSQALAPAYFPKEFPFRPQEYADYLFSFVGQVPWNKLFKTSFIKKSGLQFELRRKNEDVIFSLCTAAIAESISFCDEVFVHYRTGHATHLQIRCDDVEPQYYWALLETKKKLIAKGVFSIYERGFVSEAIMSCYFVLQHQATEKGYRNQLEFLRSEAFERLGIYGHEPLYYLTAIEYGALSWMLLKEAENGPVAWHKQMRYMMRCALGTFGLTALKDFFIYFTKSRFYRFSRYIGKIRSRPQNIN